MGAPSPGFWSRVNKTDGCWLWTGSKTSAGYGDLNFMGRHVLAHRLSFTLEHGEIPARLLVLHRCDNPLCVRPDHLFAGTDLDNHLDKQAKGRDPSRSLTGDQVRQIRRLLLEKRQKEIAEMFNVKAGVINRIAVGKTYQEFQL